MLGWMRRFLGGSPRMIEPERGPVDLEAERAAPSVSGPETEARTDPVDAPLSEQSGVDRFLEAVAAIEAKLEGDPRFASQKVHLVQLKDPAYRASYDGSVVNVARSEIAKLQRPVSELKVLDFGCWSGTTTLYLHETVGAQCWGGEIDPECQEFFENYIARPGVSLIKVIGDQVDAPSGMFDLVLGNAVFANMLPAQHEVMVRELARLAKPGGAVVIIDSNNPESPEVQARLANLYEILEGEGGSYLLGRQALIDNMKPETAPNVEAAKATCYYSPDEIAEYLAGKLPASYFEPGSLRTPYSSPRNAPSTSTPYRSYVRVLEECGLTVASGPGYPLTAPVTDQSGFVVVGLK
jgi:SAM-dependent methyltransferase